MSQPPLVLSAGMDFYLTNPLNRFLVLVALYYFAIAFAIKYTLFVVLCN